MKAVICAGTRDAAKVVEAFAFAEDKGFTSILVLITGLGTRRCTQSPQLWHRLRPIGASTITQQVTKNFLLTMNYRLSGKSKKPFYRSGWSVRSVKIRFWNSI